MLKSLHLDVVLTSFHKQLSRSSRPDTAWVLPCWMFQRADPEGKERETCWWPWRSRHKEILVCSDFGQKEMYKGYRFFGGAISVYSVSCMSNVIFNPSLLNWSSLILTVPHIYIYTVYIHIMFNNWHLIFAICVVPKYLLFLMPSTLAPSQGRRATSPMVGKRVELLGWEFTLILVG